MFIVIGIKLLVWSIKLIICSVALSVRTGQNENFGLWINSAVEQIGKKGVEIWNIIIAHFWKGVNLNDRKLLVSKYQNHVVQKPWKFNQRIFKIEGFYRSSQIVFLKN